MKRIHHRRKISKDEQVIETKNIDMGYVKTSKSSLIKSSTTSKKSSSISAEESKYFMDRSSLLEDNENDFGKEMHSVITDIIDEYPSERDIERIKQERLQKRMEMKDDTDKIESISVSSEEMDELLQWEEEKMNMGQYLVNKTITIPKDEIDQLPTEYDQLNMILSTDQILKQFDLLDQIKTTIESDEHVIERLEKELLKLYELEELYRSQFDQLQEKIKFYDELQHHLINWQTFNETMLPKLDLVKMNQENINMIESLLIQDSEANSQFLDLSLALKPLILWKQKYPDEFEKSQTISFLPSLSIFHIQFEGLYYSDISFNSLDSYSWYQTLQIFQSDTSIWKTCIQEALFIMSKR